MGIVGGGKVHLLCVFLDDDGCGKNETKKKKIQKTKLALHPVITPNTLHAPLPFPKPPNTPPKQTHTHTRTRTHAHTHTSTHTRARHRRRLTLSHRVRECECVVPVWFVRRLSPRRPSSVTALADGVGVGIHYNTLIPWRRQPNPGNFASFKYGVIGVDTLCQDLSGWRDMFVAGRMQKPVAALGEGVEDRRVAAAADVNLRAALAAALLALPEVGGGRPVPSGPVRFGPVRSGPVRSVHSPSFIHTSSTLL